MILLLGKSGYMGSAFESALTLREEKYTALSRSELDYTNLDVFGSYIAPKYHDIKLVINCAGFVGKPNVDACETSKADTILGNVLFPQMVSNICKNLNIRFMHLSSGCIYNGYDKEFTEEDESNFSFVQDNCSFYSGTKALSETLIDKDNSYICRLRIPFDEFDNERNYLSKIINYDKLLDMKNSISHRGDFVNACLDLYKQECPTGIYNIVNSGSILTSDITRLMARILNLNKEFTFFQDEEEFYKIGASAPRSNCVLDNSKLLSAGVKMRNTTEALEESLENWK
jgi:UDP-glucose 4,6-dehydratase